MGPYQTAPAAYIQVHFRLDFIMEASTMNPDQTKGSSLIWAILIAISAAKKHKQTRGADDKSQDWQEKR